MKKRTISNTNPTQAKASGVESIGSMDTWKVVQKAWNRKERWMKSTKALEIPGAGCIIHVTNQQGEKVAESMCFVPDVKLEVDPNGGRKLVSSGGSSRITFTSMGNACTSGGENVWFGDAGDSLVALEKRQDLLAKLNVFIRKTWKITPNSRQLKALQQLLAA